ncbi:MAG: SPOR domain-containing protein [Gammaproteobacteria bacterium AqS3]|nr:SPOR domain-containing protein [Gammaproteobacteria bacterium AqS3]
MKERTQVIVQRTAAVVLLVGLGLIVIPQLISDIPEDEPVEVEEAEFTPADSIPAPSEPQAVPELGLDPEEYADLTAPEIDPPATEAVVVGSSSVALAEQTLPDLSDEGTAQAWSVRLGIYGNAENIENLRKKMDALGHHVYERPLQSSDGRPLQVVLAGPFLTLQEAEQALEVAKNEMSISDARIVDYRP